jgi:release factor glutamine methyltransferase
VRPADVVRRAAGYLARHDVESPVPTAEALLMRVLQTDRAGLYLRDEGLSAAQAKRFGRALCRRCVGVPLQHLTGEQAFRRLRMIVRPGVFIPRPETEILVTHALAAIVDVASPVVVDVGTGTGAIALSMKAERPDARVLATDLSLEAVSLAAENAERLGLAIEILHGDLLVPVPSDLRGSVDLVVSDPPYLDGAAIESLPPEVRADPRLALEGDIELFERLFGQAREVLRAGGTVAVEIGDTLGRAIAEALSAAGFIDVHVERDLTGRDRVAVGTVPA